MTGVPNRVNEPNDIIQSKLETSRLGKLGHRLDQWRTLTPWVDLQLSILPIGTFTPGINSRNLVGDDLLPSCFDTQLSLCLVTEVTGRGILLQAGRTWQILGMNMLKV